MKKLEIKKFRVAKLNSPNKIVGGNYKTKTTTGQFTLTLNGGSPVCKETSNVIGDNEVM